MMFAPLLFSNLGKAVQATWRGYDLAGFGKKTEGMPLMPDSVNEATGQVLDIMRARSREEEKNNSYAAHAPQAWVDYVIGDGITPHVEKKGSSKLLRQIIHEFLGETACDYDGNQSLSGLQGTFFETMVAAGECLAMRRFMPAGSGLLNFRIQLLEPDHIDTFKTTEDGRIRQGIEYDRWGRRVAYWLFERHPNDPDYSISLQSKRVPAEDVIHGFLPRRPGQRRGIPWGHSGIIDLKELKEYGLATLTAQKVAACLGLIIYDPNNERTTKDFENLKTLKPARIYKFPGATKVDTINPPAVSNIDAFWGWQLHTASAAYGLPYEVLSKDYSQVNFSSARMSFTDFYKRVRRIQKHVITQFCKRTETWVYDGMLTQGARLPSRKMTWSPPPREMIDPAKEVGPKIKMIRAGLDTFSNFCRELGRDPEEVILEIKRNNELLDSHKVTLDIDPRKKDNAGQDQKRGGK